MIVVIKHKYKNMIKETVNEYRFMDAFRQSDTYKNNFSYHGLKALYEYFENLSEDIELDIVAICCDYSEHDSALECAKEYGYREELQAVIDSNEEDTIEEESEADALEWLQERTQVIEVEGFDYSNGITDAPIVKSIIIQPF